MGRRTWTSIIALLTLTTGLAGCIGSEEPIGQTGLTEAGTRVQVLSPDGEPAAFARIGALDEADRVLEMTSADTNGTFPPTAIPLGAATVHIQGTDNASWVGTPDDLTDTIRLSVPDDPASSLVGDGDRAATGILGFLEPLRLGTTYLAEQPQTCEFYNCGASEPVLEVASDGSVYVSGTCCIGQSPPIWVSREAGAQGTFELLDGDVLRDNYGIEGDFSIDNAGNLYFTDISVASAYIASWGPDGEHRHTLPAGPFVPIVDRPWTRAGAEDVVHFFYNTGTSTMYYKSTDGGIIWLPKMRFDGGLGTPGQGPTRDHLWVTAGGDLYESTDAGETWENVGEIPRPSDEGTTFQAYDVPVVDEAGNVWIVYDWRKGPSGGGFLEEDPGEGPFHVYATRLDSEGRWHGPFQVSPPEGTHHLPWVATGQEGALAIAWYGTLDDEAGPNSVTSDAEWYLWSAVSVDATSEDPSFQWTNPDPQRVHEGPMNRKLLDFLQVEIGPDDRVHIAYAQDRNGQPDEATQYVRSATGFDLAPAEYPNGP